MGVVVEAGETRVCNAGYTGFFKYMRLIGQLGIDFAILPIAYNFTMDPDDALHALEFIASKRALPVHYNTFSQIRRTPRITWPESKRWACGANSSNQVKA